MAEPIEITLNGEVIPLPLIMNFATLERAWPAILARSKAVDRVNEVSAACAVASAVLIETRPDLTVSEIKARLRVRVGGPVDEREILLRATDRLCEASGLVPAGEAEPPENPAAETTDSTSNTSSPS